MDRIGNTDGVNIDSCRHIVVESIFISNSDDGANLDRAHLQFHTRLEMWRSEGNG